MNIAEAIRRMAQGSTPTTSIVCTVDSVDRSTNTCDCTPLDDSAPLLGVNMQAGQSATGGIVIVPKVGSHVVVGMVSGGNAGIVLLTEDIETLEVKIGNSSIVASADTITLNGGQLGGLVLVAELIDKLNSVIDAFNQHTHTLLTGTVAVQGSATAQANVAPISVPAITSPLQPVQRRDIENTAILQ